LPPHWSGEFDDGDSRDLAASLLAKADLGNLVAITRLGTHSNAHYLVGDSGGGRYVLRRFSEKAPPHSALVRLDRECWVYQQLTRAGVPMPRLVARSREPGAEAMLTAKVEGEHLGTIVATVPPREAVGAWSSCGDALASVHSIDGCRAAAAGCERVGMKRPAASRGPWHQQEALTYLDQLAVIRRDLGPLAELTAAAEDALALYQQAPLALCQYDAHLWQFLVARSVRGQWECAAILDWEHADLDDPDWDLAQLDGFRWANLGPVPRDFFVGYRRFPTSPLYMLYRLERAAWILTRCAEGENDWLALSVPGAEGLIRGLLARPQELREKIAAPAD
jgi:aminoglycoside phosphotransferase (APT) family kinase protein